MKNPPYKAKGLEEDKWFYGNLVDAMRYGKVAPHIQFGEYAYASQRFYGAPIKKDTLCRNTFLKDVKGKEAFHNDTVSHPELGNGTVEHNSLAASFGLRFNDEPEIMLVSMYILKQCTITGNKFD